MPLYVVKKHIFERTKKPEEELLRGASNLSENFNDTPRKNNNEQHLLKALDRVLPRL